MLDCRQKFEIFCKLVEEEEFYDVRILDEKNDYLVPVISNQEDFNLIKKSIFEAKHFYFVFPENWKPNLNEIINTHEILPPTWDTSLPFRSCFFAYERRTIFTFKDITETITNPNDLTCGHHIEAILAIETKPCKIRLFCLVNMIFKDIERITKQFYINPLNFTSKINKLIYKDKIYYSSYRLIDYNNERKNTLESKFKEIVLQRLFSKNFDFGLSKQKYKIKYKDRISKEKKFHSIKDIVYVCPRKAKIKDSLIGQSIDWSHRWRVMGHWRKIDRIGKDRAGNYNINDFTWVKDYVKGLEKLPLIEKKRIILNSSNSRID